jgi:hypothetical protein
MFRETECIVIVWDYGRQRLVLRACCACRYGSDTGARFFDRSRSRNSKILYTFVGGVVLMNLCKSPSFEIPTGYWSNSYHGVVLCSFASLQKATMSFVLYVCLSVRQPAWNKAAATGRIFMKFDIRIYFGNMSRKLKFY